MTALLVIGILVLLIITHELGHFIAAKFSRVRVQEFGVGYPPRAFLFGTIGDTEYTFNWIPFGGFVRLFGDEGEGQHGRGSFADASRGKQIFILSAGVLMNVLIAWVLLCLALHIGVPRVVETTGADVRLLVSDIVAGSPADTAGIHAGDQVIAVADMQGGYPTMLSPEAIKDFVAQRGGQRVMVEYVRSGATTTASAIPANAVVPGAAGRPALGLGLALVSAKPLPWAEAAGVALYETGSGLLRVAANVWSMLVGAVSGTLNLSGVMGPVGLVSVVSEAAQTGFAQVLALAAFISVNLVVINLVPIPALDGGRIVIVATEAFLRRPVSRLGIHVLNFVGIAAIIFLMIIVTYHDIARLVA